MKNNSFAIRWSRMCLHLEMWKRTHDPKHALEFQHYFHMKKFSKIIGCEKT